MVLGLFLFYSQLGKSEMYVDGQQVSEPTQEWVATKEALVPGSKIDALVCCNNATLMDDLNPWSYPYIFLLQIRMSKNSDIKFRNLDGKMVHVTCGSEKKCYDPIKIAGTTRGSNGLSIRYYCGSNPDTDMTGNRGFVGIGIFKGKITIDDMPNAPEACGGSVLSKADTESRAPNAEKMQKPKSQKAPYDKKGTLKNSEPEQYADSGEGQNT
jgi:hypothetical protein